MAIYKKLDPGLDWDAWCDDHPDCEKDGVACSCADEDEYNEEDCEDE